MPTPQVQNYGGQTYQGFPIAYRCPHCRVQGTFHGMPNVAEASFQSDYGPDTRAGVRVCPNPACKRVLFVFAQAGKLISAYPPEVIDFDASNLPAAILASLEEAVTCHANGAYRACALMVRRVLEELCADRGATGANLKARLQKLGGTVVVPTELLDAADELRLLGNDAAHIEAQLYDEIGRDEASLAVELAKELLKAVYQYRDLVGRLKALRKDAPPG
jgi:hypothetical protein